jgi:MraZ protein
MSYLIGEFECKLDTKGRMMIPAGLKKQLPEAESEGLVINRGFKKYLVIYTKQEWDKKLDELNKLNQYETKSIEFIRYFTRGATELIPDSTGRVNLPQLLLDYAGIKNDVVLTCQLNKIEVWDKATHREMIENEPADFASLAEEVMGTKKEEAK